MRITSKQASRILLIAGILALGSCAKDEPLVSTPSPDPTALVQDFQKMQETAAALAKTLASDLNGTSEHRKELFTKIANKFDGDFDILVAHLKDNTLEAIQNNANALAKNTNRAANVREAIKTIPKLQLMMPYAKSWTDRRIQEAGGLIVAYYPFGMDDRSVQAIVGYDKTGNQVTITQKTAPTIPYVILSSNERTEADGYLKATNLYDPELKFGLKKSQSLNAIDPKYYSISEQPDWQDKPISNLSTIGMLPMLKPWCDPELNPEGCGELGGGGGSSGGGPVGPGLLVGEFKTGDINSYEFWLEGEAEIYAKVKQMALSTSIAGIPVDFFESTFMTTWYHDYDLNGGYWLGWTFRKPWTERQSVEIAGMRLYNDNFRVQIIDLDDWFDDILSEGDFNKSTFVSWGQEWQIGPAPVTIKIFQY